MRAAGDQMRTRIVDAIQELTARNSRPPTNRELGEMLGGKSTGHIDYHLRILRQQNVILHDPKKSRGIMLNIVVEAPVEPLSESNLRPLPFVSTRIRLQGRIAAGQPIEAYAEPDGEYIDVMDSIGREDNVYALRVKGKSMIEDLIDDNDIVVVRPQKTANNGDTVVALICSDSSDRGEVTLKRFYREKNGKIRLQPANSTMDPIFVRESDVEIQGRVISVIREV